MERLSDNGVWLETAIYVVKDPRDYWPVWDTLTNCRILLLWGPWILFQVEVASHLGVCWSQKKRSIKEKKKRNETVNRDANKGAWRRLSKKVVCKSGSRPRGSNDIQEDVWAPWSKEHIFRLLGVLGSTALCKGSEEVNMELIQWKVDICICRRQRREMRTAGPSEK